MFIDSKGMQVGGLNLAGEHKKRADSTQQHPPELYSYMVNLIAKGKDIREGANRQALLPCAVLLEGAVRPASRRNGWHPESK